MDINLLSQNFLLIQTMALTAATTFIVLRLPRRRKERLRQKKAALASLLAAIILAVLIQLAFSSDKLPFFLWLMVLPATIGPSLVWLAWNNKLIWLKWLAIASTAVGVIFSLLLINNFYRFYPTLGSVINSEKQQQEIETTIRYANAESGHRSKTLEASLYSEDIDTKGQVLPVSIPGKVSGFPARKAWVYIPAIAAADTKINLPVLVLTPGFPGLTENWLGTGLEDVTNNFARSHHGITPMIFMVDNTGSLTNDTECVNSPRGNVETYLAVDVPNYIKSHYEVNKRPSSWAIGGLSLGGLCATMITLRHPNVYHYFLDFGGEVAPEIGPPQTTIDTLFHGSVHDWQAHQPLKLLHNKQFPGLGGFFVVGKSDRRELIAGLRSQYEAAKNAGMDTVYEEIGGEHTFDVWKQAYKDALPWLSNRLGATECQSGCSSNN